MDKWRAILTFVEEGKNLLLANASDLFKGLLEIFIYSYFYIFISLY